MLVGRWCRVTFGVGASTNFIYSFIYKMFLFQDQINFMYQFRVLLVIVSGGGRVVRWCWVNVQSWGVLIIWIIVGHGPAALAVGAGGVVWTFFSLIYPLSFLPLSGRRPDID